MVDFKAQSIMPIGSGASSDPPSDLIEIARIAGAHGVRGWLKIQPFSSDSNVLDSVKRWWLSPPARPLDNIQAGELDVASSNESAGQLMAYPKVDARRFKHAEVMWARVHGASWLANIKGLSDRDEAQALKGSSIWVSRGDFPSLDDDEFYWVDLIGCEVYSLESGESDVAVAADQNRSEQSQPRVSLSEKSVRLGMVDSVVDNPAHPLLSVLRQHQDDSGAWVPEVSAKGKPVYTLIPFVVAHVPVVDITNRRILVDWPSDF